MSSDPRGVLHRPTPPPDATVRYGDHPDQIADVRMPPPRAKARPLVIVVHGGFWRAEWDRSHISPLAAALAAAGYPVAQLEYRRTGQPGGGWPGTFADVVAGVTAIPQLMGLGWAPPLLLGHSAGGHLALWYALAGPAPVLGVVALAPVADLAEAHRLDLDQGAVAALLGGGPTEVPDRYAEADPSARTPPGVRSVIIHGARDRHVPVEISRKYTATARAEGGDVSLIELPESEHFALIDPQSSAWPVVKSTLQSMHP
ncbi:alpha/beta hydrolase [Phytohabitans sp. ZYX-F-186]|uniref:Alpha/beta hydrolase n=1 Tax=Phytohabitans maris TaxID=3071409 RepID=A0ABU0ZL25_9ACTN|nr:alpha/beta hydrolase [Phytohabitans sp. ZYX-F-186]MDQ7907097.1 alpha/beta hydrolase [Phytohabitans sp. ZYX-F-186]